MDGKRNIVLIWVVILIVGLGIVGGFLTWFTYNNTQDELNNIADQIDPNKIESGFTADELCVCWSRLYH